MISLKAASCLSAGFRRRREHTQYRSDSRVRSVGFESEGSNAGLAFCQICRFSSFFLILKSALIVYETTIGLHPLNPYSSVILLINLGLLVLMEPSGNFDILGRRFGKPLAPPRFMWFLI